MKIEKAIEILDLEITVDFEGNEKDRQDAVKLGIKALEYIQVWRKALPLTNPQLLPGETKEAEIE